jgi:serine/threonine-protein kinase HipA
VNVIDIFYDGQLAGAISFDRETGIGSFQYDKKFIRQGIELSPVVMPLSKQIYTFPALRWETFKGLPGLVADSLPDDFGNTLLNSWTLSIDREVDSITPLERLSYTGSRGMGALEYRPSTKIRGLNASTKVEIDSLVQVAQEVLDGCTEFTTTLESDRYEDSKAMIALLSVGTSAGGARPKAVLAFNEDLTEVRSGQTDAPDGFTHYLMKFDGVSEHNRDKETFGDPLGFGAMEYVYSLMAKACDIDMMPTELLPEGNRRHFLTGRFDRVGNKKVHVQTLNGLAHIDYRKPGSFSYEELFDVARKLKLPLSDAEELLRRMVFNVVARNHDDHSKNFAFMLDEQNQWRLSPAYDLVYSYKPGSKWVEQHWMMLNMKRDLFQREDFYIIEKVVPSFTRKNIDEVINKTVGEVSNWRSLAEANDVPKTLIEEVESNLRLML